MTDYVLSGSFLATFSLVAGDTLAVKRLGGVVPASSAGAAAVVAAASNTVTIEGDISDIFAARDGISLVGGSSTLTIASTGYVYGDQNGVLVGGSLNTISNSGRITGRTTNGISTQAFSASVTCDATSMVTGALYGVYMSGSSGNRLTNSGQITGGTGAVYSGAGVNTIINSGTMTGASRGVEIGLGPDASGIVNSGVIRADNGQAILTDSPLNLVNSGTLDSPTNYCVLAVSAVSAILNSGYIFARSSVAIGQGNAADIIVNNGFILGGAGIAVTMSGGTDLFDGRNGLQFGNVLGGDGDDTLFGGIGNDFLYGGNDNDQLLGGGAGDYLDGGAGFDYVRYDLGGPVMASLATPSANTGDAATDTYVSIEGLIGSQAGDVLLGDGGNNTLFGLGGQDGIAGGAGNDTIYGGDGGDSIAGEGGNDVIYGGAGGDVLSGGAAADIFVYTSVADGGDFIQDFNAGGVRDSIDLRPLFDGTGYLGTTPRSDNILKVLQNGADADVYVYGAFLVRVAKLYAPALDDTYFLYQ